MEEKKITLSNGKEYIISEVKYKDMVSNSMSENKEEGAKFLILGSTGMTEEEYAELGMKDGLVLQKAVNEINGLDESFLQSAPPSDI